MVDINNSNTRSVVESTDLGKFSQIQSIALNQKCTAYGVASFDGRANLSSINKNVNGNYASVNLLLSRNQQLHLRAISRKREETPFFILSTLLVSILSTNDGS